VVAILRSPAWMLLMEKEREALLAKYDATEGDNKVDEK
jgi:hypothetical protein